MREILRSTTAHTTSVTPLGSRLDEQAHGRLLNADPPCRELAYRSNDGLEVTLSWQSATDELVVCVCDRRHGAYFEIRPERHLALEVFNHPYSYVAFTSPEPAS
jgi:hypothetical protein